jgi:hypothetical protein
MIRSAARSLYVFPGPNERATRMKPSSLSPLGGELGSLEPLSDIFHALRYNRICYFRKRTHGWGGKLLDNDYGGGYGFWIELSRVWFRLEDFIPVDIINMIDSIIRVSRGHWSFLELKL